MKKCILPFLAVIIGFTLTAQTTLYVNAATVAVTQDGQSWTTAFETLQDALDVAVSGDQIWVAKGTYVPSKIADEKSSTDPRDMSFSIPNGVSVYGGFDGTEPTSYDITLRDFTTNKSILSGDLDGTPANNAHHVVILVTKTAAITLDGFTISDGKANGASNTLIQGLSVYRHQGGAAFIVSNGFDVNFSNNTVSNNLSTNRGGGVLVNTVNASSSIFLSNNTISNNTSSDYGGGFHASSNAGSIHVLNNTVSNNSAVRGGGTYIYTLDNTDSKIYFSKNIVSNNSSTDVGTGLYANAVLGTIYISNNLINNNTSTASGFGCYLYGKSDIYFVNNTVANNSSTVTSGAVGGLTIRNQAGTTGTIYVYNTIFFQNSNATNNSKNLYIYDDTNTKTVDVTNCLIGGGYTFPNTKGGVVTLTNITDVDPLFVDATNSDFTITSGSPAREAGDNTLYNESLYGSTDLLGIARIMDPIIDLGAYEYDITTSIGNKPLANSISWKNTAHTLTVSGLKGYESISLFDINGRQLLNKKATSADFTTPIGSFSPGIYFIRITSQEGTSSVKFVK